MQTDFTSSDCPVPNFPGLNSSGSAAGPLLDAQETSVLDSIDSSYREFVTSGCRKQMLHTRRVFESLDDDHAAKRLAAFAACRSSAWFVRHKKSGKIRVASSRCRQRWCPLCIRTKRYVIQQSVGAWLKSIKQPKFMTLTLAHTNSPIPDQIDNLYKFFKALKRHLYFKKRVKGGVWFFQIKKSATDGLWHPHIHILFEGRYIEHAEISKIWASITHGSKVVDIRAVKNAQKAADYVARYAAAPCDLCDLSLEDSLAVVRGLHSRRICGAFGTGSVVKFAAKAPEDAKDWEFVGSFTGVMNMAYSVPEMKDVVKCWQTGEFCSYVPPPRVVPGDVLSNSMTQEPETFRQLWLF